MDKSNSAKYSIGFSLLELMVVIIVIAILVMISIPTYREYMVKTRISSSLTVAKSLKAKVHQFYAKKNKLPCCGVGSGGNTGPVAINNPDKYISSISWVGNTNLTGKINVKFTNEMDAIAGKDIDLVATIDPTTKALTWECKVNPSTPIDKVFLPTECS